jgi:hypothetical protein
MKILAVRCSNTDFAHALLEGTQDNPTLSCSGITAFPKGYDEHSLLYWFYQEIGGILTNYRPDGLAVKAAETMVKRSVVLELRIRIEGVALMAAAEAGCANVCRKVKSTIAKDLGMKGKAKYLETQLDTSAIADFDSLKVKEQEAVLAGWSCLE